MPLREAEKTNTSNVLNVQNDLTSTERLRFAEETKLRLGATVFRAAMS